VGGLIGNIALALGASHKPTPELSHPTPRV
jgi:hypothetical protein